jgi:hypothetical protein
MCLPEGRALDPLKSSPRLFCRLAFSQGSVAAVPAPPKFPAAPFRKSALLHSMTWNRIAVWGRGQKGASPSPSKMWGSSGLEVVLARFWWGERRCCATDHGRQPAGAVKTSGA